MASAIVVGDSVQLKSGGPKMTVAEIKPWNGVMTAWCDWFEGSKKMSDSFPLTSLKQVEEQQRVQVGGGRPPGTWS